MDKTPRASLEVRRSVLNSLITKGGSTGLTNGRRKTDQRDMSSGRRVEALTESCMICPAGLSGTNILRRSGLTVEERFSKTRDRNQKSTDFSCTSRMR